MAAGPTVMPMAVLVALVNVGSVAVSVYPVPTLLMLQPLNVATPATAAFDVQERVAPEVPLPDVRARVTVDVLFVTGNPDASSIVTTGCCAKFTPPVEELLGWAVNANFVAVPATLNAVLVPVTVPVVAWRVNSPGPAVPSLMLQPLKVAMPPAAFLDAQVSVPDPVLIAIVTGLVKVVIRSPAESSTHTTG